MGQSYSNIKDLYNDINKIDGYIREMNLGNNAIGHLADNAIYKYCHYWKEPGQDKYKDYLGMTSSGVIYVLKTLKEKYNLEYVKLAEYAILWLRYKLNQSVLYNTTSLNDFYTKNIEKNNDYNIKINGDGSPTYKDIIDKKKDLMNIQEMTKFSYPFKLLLLLYNKNNNKSGNCDHSDDAKKFADEFEKISKISNNIGSSSYNKMLYILSDDYNNLKNKCTNFPPLPKIKTPLTTLIPALSTFSVIPAFLGIAYKYSLFGVDKLFQRQYIRKKLKKVKKKMKLNI
ncbi:CIR protein PIR protein [Plasmodium vinckei brucechwatti]|uniref:CIR protein PIR protein n=1 Tax=Plasmodium vinckei brucechwatti TaxID=119398 RepID=A0A6V7RTD6_PLAVN|nr:CIR protein PIR protein [Plasmodium vinckei brucechwatti]